MKVSKADYIKLDEMECQFRELVAAYQFPELRKIATAFMHLMREIEVEEFTAVITDDEATFI